MRTPASSFRFALNFGTLTLLSLACGDAVLSTPVPIAVMGCIVAVLLVMAGERATASGAMFAVLFYLLLELVIAPGEGAKIAIIGGFAVVAMITLRHLAWAAREGEREDAWVAAHPLSVVEGATETPHAVDWASFDEARGTWQRQSFRASP